MSGREVGRPRFGIWLLGLAFAGGVATQFLPTTAADEFPTMPAAMARGDSRLDIVGPDVSKAGGAVVTLKSELVTYRQTCLGACDQLLINFIANGEDVYRLSVADAAGRVLFKDEAYVDGHSWDRLSAGRDGRLALQSGLVAQWPPYGARVRPEAR